MRSVIDSKQTAGEGVKTRASTIQTRKTDKYEQLRHCLYQ